MVSPTTKFFLALFASPASVTSVMRGRGVVALCAKATIGAIIAAKSATDMAMIVSLAVLLRVRVSIFLFLPFAGRAVPTPICLSQINNIIIKIGNARLFGGNFGCFPKLGLDRKN